MPHVLRAARVRSIDDPKAQLTLRQVEALLRRRNRRAGGWTSASNWAAGSIRRRMTCSDSRCSRAPRSGTCCAWRSSYQRLIQPVFALSLQRHAGRVDLVYLPAVALPHRSMRVLEEAIVVSNHFAFQSMLRGKLPPYDVWMSIERPPHARALRELSPARVHFGDAVPGVRISLDAALLDTPLAMANPRAMQAAEERCKAMLRQTHARRRWSEWCRMMLRESEDSRPTLEQLAGFVNISPRTLARYLEAEDTSFRDLSLQVRTERARQLLAEGRPVGDADRLPARLQRRRELRAQLPRADRPHADVLPGAGAPASGQARWSFIECF